MDIQTLQDLLSPWLRTETWHTHHPLDEARFNRAIAATVESLGTSLDEGMFLEAITQSVQGFHPRLLPDARDEAARYWARRAEHIVGFLRDTREH